MCEFCDLGADSQEVGLVRQPVPVLVQHVEVAPVLVVPRVRLDQVVDRDRLVQGRLLPRGPVVFGEGIDAEDLPVDQLHRGADPAVRGGRRLGFPVRGDRPVEAPVLLVPEVLRQVVVGVARHLEVGRVMVDAVGRREGPEDPARQERAPRHVVLHLHVRGDHPHKAPVLGVSRVLEPEWQDIALKLLLGARRELRQVRRGRRVDGGRARARKRQAQAEEQGKGSGESSRGFHRQVQGLGQCGTLRSMPPFAQNFQPGRRIFFGYPESAA
jgi:hypothetical protein